MPNCLPLILGVYGRTPSRRMIAHLRRTSPAGLLILTRNIESPAQTRALIEEITQRLGRRLIVSIDHEGGWVVRFEKSVTAFPGNAALGRTGDANLARAVGQRMAEDLRSLGITLNLAPVLDVLTAGYNPGILIRSFGPNVKLCSRLGQAFIRGLEDNGVWACAKHFPGKGAARKDAHYALPVIRASRSQIAQHLKPFEAAIDAGVSCVMSSHVVMPALDSQPATFSAPIIRGILRQRLGYSGVIVSDDLGMGGATTKRSVPQAAKDALKVGHDLLIVAHDPEAQIRTAETLREYLRTNAAQNETALSQARFEILSRPPLPAKKGKNKARAGQENLDLLIARRAAAVVRLGKQKLPLQHGRPPALVIIPNFKQASELFCFEGGLGGPELFVKNLLKGRINASFAQSPITAESPQALARLNEGIKRAPAVVFFCFEAMRFAGQRATLNLLNQRAPEKTVICLIRNSRDIDLIPARSTVIDAFGFRNCQLRAALELVFGRRRIS